MSEASNDLLPPLGLETLQTIVASARTLSRRLHAIQKLVERTLPQFEILAAGGLTPTEICALLAENGSVGKDGHPIPKSSLTSAMRRARKRASPTASGCIGQQLAAVGCYRLPLMASRCGKLPRPP